MTACPCNHPLHPLQRDIRGRACAPLDTTHSGSDLVALCYLDTVKVVGDQLYVVLPSGYSSSEAGVPRPSLPSGSQLPASSTHKRPSSKSKCQAAAAARVHQNTQPQHDDLTLEDEGGVCECVVVVVGKGEGVGGGVLGVFLPGHVEKDKQ